MFTNTATGKADAATVTAAITPAAGNILVVSGFSNAGGAVSCSDTAGHIWTKVGGAAMSGGYGTSGIWYAYNVKGQATTVSVTGSGNSGYVLVGELPSAAPTLDPFDGISAVATNTTTPAVTNAVTTTVGADTLVGIYHTAGFTFAAGSGWGTPVSIAGYIVGGMESRDVTTTGAYTATATVDGGSTWQGYVLAFGVDPNKRTTAAKTATTATQVAGTWTNPTSATGAANSTGGTANTTGTVPNNCAYWSNAAASSTATLELSGYNFAAEVGSNPITGVTATIGHAESSTTTISALTAQLYSGTTAIGTAQAITRSTTYTTTTISSWGALPTAAQLADLRVRIAATHNTGTTTRVLYVDAVSLTVGYTAAPAAPSYDSSQFLPFF